MLCHAAEEKMFQKYQKVSLLPSERLPMDHFGTFGSRLCKEDEDT
jgi:hypothetical protein